ncbi:MAG: hypothetical protein NWQ23_14865 [Yoonia sp.]|uniref:capsular polysaccharide export protein, LipB/KpsS family n=1 Tax=Yoonia sp. TaxID=2212373 RepID=UPI00273D274D|nr:hypothetical protein [Yoonia sp.]MDP5086697.1 hypothetical protein [Yoonia sp.]
MSARDTVTFYLHPKLRKQAEQGNHNFIKKVSDVLTDAGLQIAFDNDDDLARLRALARPGRSLFLMDEPVNTRGLTFRKTYIYPFWHIEKQGRRWTWPVAEESFDPALVDPKKAANFYRFWRLRLFDEAPQHARADGFVYVPLQGQLLRKRSFQLCSPIDMVKTVLECDAGRQVVATLHPSETYSPDEQRALEDLQAENERLFVRAGGTEQLLQTCDYIVTQNSSVGFMGYFFGKPLILFAKTDFHHIALKVAELGVAAAFDQVSQHRPDYAAYLQWFLQQRAINAGRPEANKKICTVLRGHGWPV